MFVFDKYAIVLKDKSKVISAVYFDKFREEVVPPQMEIALYDELEYTDATFDKVTFWDYSGKNDYQMLGAIRTSGAITIHPFDFTIDPDEMLGVMTKDDNSQSYLLPSTEISVFKTSKEFLVVGCATCNKNQGWLRFYNPRNIKLLKGLPGNSKEKFVG